MERVLTAGIAYRDARSIARYHKFVSERVEGIEDPIGSEAERSDKSRTRTGQQPQIRDLVCQEIHLYQRLGGRRITGRHRSCSGSPTPSHAPGPAKNW